MLRNDVTHRGFLRLCVFPFVSVYITLNAWNSKSFLRYKPKYSTQIFGLGIVYFMPLRRGWNAHIPCDAPQWRPPAHRSLARRPAAAPCLYQTYSSGRCPGWRGSAFWSFHSSSLTTRQRSAPYATDRPEPLSHATMMEPMSSTPRTVPFVPMGGAWTSSICRSSTRVPGLYRRRKPSRAAFEITRMFLPPFSLRRSWRPRSQRGCGAGFCARSCSPHRWSPASKESSGMRTCRCRPAFPWRWSASGSGPFHTGLR